MKLEGLRTPTHHPSLIRAVWPRGGLAADVLLVLLGSLFTAVAAWALVRRLGPPAS